MVHDIVWYLMLAAFGIALADAVLMVLSPPKHRKFAAWYLRNPRFLKAFGSDLQTRLHGAATILFFALMVAIMYFPSVRSWPHWGVTFALGFLGF
jgi:hypothetical protein